MNTQEPCLTSLALNDKDVIQAISPIVAEIKDGALMESVTDELPTLSTPAELARFMRTTTNSLAQDRYLGRGVPFIKVGRRVRYSRSDVLAYLERNTMQRTDDPRGGAA
jgi:hypothetical protein